MTDITTKEGRYALRDEWAGVDSGTIMVTKRMAVDLLDALEAAEAEILRLRGALDKICVLK